MHPTIALLLTTTFVLVLFWRDIKERPDISGAVWIPFVWMLLTCSRSIAEWIGAGPTYDSPSDLVDGSPLDRLAFLTLQLGGLIVLVRRRLAWSTLVSRNMAMVVFLAYCFFAVLWSDFPFVAFKRWFKVLGLPIMVLVIATEPNPREAFIRLMKRSAYVLIPFSIMLIKYYPQLGRHFSVWTGDATNSGVTTNKNELGYVCLLLGLFFVWHLLTVLRRGKTPGRRHELALIIGFLWMIAWLLFMARSATSVTALAIGVSTLLFLGLRFIKPRHAFAYLVGALVIFLGAEALFGVTDVLIGALGRESTLSGRVQLWDELSRIDINPFVGAGFESFWLGERAERLWAHHWWRPNQAHNGYLETYLNLGVVGVGLLAAWIVATLVTVRSALLSDFDFGRFRLAALITVVVYNYTEASFKGPNPIWLLFFMIAIDYPTRRRATRPTVVGAMSSRGGSRELVPAATHAVSYNGAMRSTPRGTTGRQHIRANMAPRLDAQVPEG